MNQENFTQKRGFLYHLTDVRNVDAIINDRMIYCTNFIIDNADGIPIDKKETLKSTRRNSHAIIHLNGIEISIRDQKPLFLKSLSKCLTNNWGPERYITLLNGRVFFWPTLKRLSAHHNTYMNEHPAILRVRTRDMLDKNPRAELCHLNSGATRPVARLGGLASPRGENTFVPIETYDKIVSSVAEVTFPERCILPDTVWISGSPNGPWELT